MNYVIEDYISFATIKAALDAKISELGLKSTETLVTYEDGKIVYSITLNK